MHICALKIRLSTTCNIVWHETYMGCMYACKYVAHYFCTHKAIISILNVSHHHPYQYILEGHIKIDYLVKSYAHWQFFVEILF